MTELTVTQGKNTIDFRVSGEFICESVDSSSIGSTTPAYTAIQQYGQIVGDTTYNARSIPCQLAIKPIRGNKYDMAYLDELWQKVIKVLMPHKRCELTLHKNGKSYKINARVPEINSYTYNGGFATFEVNFLADDPMWRDAISTEYVFGTVKPLFKFPCTFANGNLRFGEWQKEFTYCNTNDVETPFKLVIQGVSDYCKITNDNGEFIKVNKAVATGQTLTIDTATGIVTLADENGVISYANQYVSLDSTLGMKLHEGVNILTYENGLSSLPVATITINQYYLGV
jgi:hypothetical protein